MFTCGQVTDQLRPIAISAESPSLKTRQDTAVTAAQYLRCQRQRPPRPGVRFQAVESLAAHSNIQGMRSPILTYGYPYLTTANPTNLESLFRTLSPQNQSQESLRKLWLPRLKTLQSCDFSTLPEFLSTLITYSESTDTVNSARMLLDLLITEPFLYIFALIYF